MMKEGKIDIRRQGYKKTFERPTQWRSEIMSTLRQKNREGQLTKIRMDASSAYTNEDIDNPNVVFVDGDSELVKTDVLVVAKWMESDDVDLQRNGCLALRLKLSRKSFLPLGTVVRSGCIPPLVKFLSSGDRQTQFNASWALTNIASGDTCYTKAVSEAGAVPIFVQHLLGGTPDIVEQAMWALGNIAGDGAELRDEVLQAGGMDNIKHVVNEAFKEGQAKISLLRISAWTISNIVRALPPPQINVIEDGLGLICLMFAYDDIPMCVDSCWALSFITDPHRRRETDGVESESFMADLVLQRGLSFKLVDFLKHTDNNLKRAALRTVGNIVAGSDTNTQMMVNSECIPALLAILRNPSSFSAEQKEALWALSNVAAGSFTQIQSIIDCDGVRILIHILQNGTLELQQEAAWTISNILSGGHKVHIDVLLAEGVLTPMARLLETDGLGRLKYDSKIVEIVLQGLIGILSVGKHANEEVFKKYLELLEHDIYERLENIASLAGSNIRNIHLAKKASEIIYTFLPVDEDDCEVECDE